MVRVSCLSWWPFAAPLGPRLSFATILRGLSVSIGAAEPSDDQARRSTAWQRALWQSAPGSARSDARRHDSRRVLLQPSSKIPKLRLPRPCCNSTCSVAVRTHKMPPGRAPPRPLWRVATAAIIAIAVITAHAADSPPPDEGGTLAEHLSSLHDANLQRRRERRRSSSQQRLGAARLPPPAAAAGWPQDRELPSVPRTPGRARPRQVCHMHNESVQPTIDRSAQVLRPLARPLPLAPMLESRYLQSNTWHFSTHPGCLLKCKRTSGKRICSIGTCCTWAGRLPGCKRRL